MSAHPWEEILKRIEQESDRAKIAELAKKLNDAMIAEETEKVRNRIGISPKTDKATRPPRVQPKQFSQYPHRGSPSVW